MITLNIDSPKCSGVYLDHKELINISYNDYQGPEQYQLQEHLFDFKPKPITDSTTSKSRKRKAEIINLSQETIKLKETFRLLLGKLHESKDFNSSRSDIPENIPRVWEEPVVFPQFHGANTRMDFQKFTHDNREYLIPPNCRFFNYDLLNLKSITDKLEKYDLIVIDPPWRNKYIRRIKKAKPELGYKMLDNDVLSDIELGLFIDIDSIVAVWCTNSKQHQQRLLEEFLPRWDLKLIHKVTWMKLNTDGELIGEINEEGKKQPYEVLFIACHRDGNRDYSKLKELEFILSVPSIIHSHKPPIVELFRGILAANPKCLELFARYLQPHFTSIGLEVLKLMDTRLYREIKAQKNL